MDNISALKTQQRLTAVRNAMDKLGMQDKLDVLQTAKTKLPEDERAFIDYLADDLIEAVKKRSSVVRMSRAGALELLAALGVWISGRVQAEEQRDENDALNLSDLRGIAPNITQNQSSEDFIRELRDAW